MPNASETTVVARWAQKDILLLFNVRRTVRDADVVPGGERRCDTSPGRDTSPDVVPGAAIPTPAPRYQPRRGPRTRYQPPPEQLQHKNPASE